MDTIASDYITVHEPGLYEIFANFIWVESDPANTIVVDLMCDNRVAITSEIPVEFFINDMKTGVCSQACWTTALLVEDQEDHEVYVRVRLDKGSELYQVHESSFESELTHPQGNPFADEEAECLMLYDVADNQPRKISLEQAQNWIEDEHIEDTEVELTAGSGLTGGGELQIRFEPAPETVLNIDPDTNTMTFFVDGREVVTLNTKTGGVRLDPDFDYETGAKEFWRAVATAFPQMFVQALHIEDEPLGSESERAYERAMEMFKNG